MPHIFLTIECGDKICFHCRIFKTDFHFFNSTHPKNRKNGVQVVLKARNIAVGNTYVP